MKTWFTYHYGLPNGKHSRPNPYSNMLKALRKPLARQPGQRSCAQAYLRDNLERVNKLYEERVSTAEKTGIVLRTSIAQELLDQESQEFRDELKARLAAEHAEAVRKYKEASVGSPSSDPEDIAE